MQKHQNNKFIFYLAGFNLLVCFFVMSFFVLQRHFSIDDYWLYHHQSSSALSDISSNLRIVSGCLYFLLDKAGINTVSNQIVFGVFLIGAFAWVATYLSLEVADSMDIQGGNKKLLLLNAGTLVMLLNSSLGEYLYFSGVYLQWAISLIGMAIAAVYIGKKENCTRNWIQGVAALVITAGSYQIFMAQYVYLVMFFIFVKDKGCASIRSVWKSIRAAGAAFIAVFFNYMCVQALVKVGVVDHKSRMQFNFSELPELLFGIVQAQKAIWVEGMGVYPEYSLCLSLFFMLGVLSVMLYRRKVKIGTYIFAGMVLISGQCVMWAATVLQGHISILLRMVSPVFCVYTVGVWMFCYYHKPNSRNLAEKVVLAAIILFLGCSSIKIQKIATDTQVTNAVTKCYVQEIDHRISSYEKKHNIKISKVGFCTDMYISYKFYNYIQTDAYGDFCYNPFLPDWSNIACFNYYSGRDLVSTEVPEHIQRYYKNKNWDSANWDEQIYFDDDTIYICAF